LAYALSEEKLNALFGDVAQMPYEKELLFSTTITIVTREHAANAPWDEAGTRRQLGRIETGMVHDLLRAVARGRFRRVLRRATEQPFEVRQATLELGEPRIALGELAFQLCDPRVPPICHEPSSVNERGPASSREKTTRRMSRRRAEASF
jgi:hypothetical protein